jgi:hypothetical protein
MISIGLSATLLLDIDISSFIGESRIQKVKLSLYSNLIEVGVNYCFVFWFINDDNKQTSIPSCVVEER